MQIKDTVKDSLEFEARIYILQGVYRLILAVGFLLATFWISSSLENQLNLFSFSICIPYLFLSLILLTSRYRFLLPVVPLYLVDLFFVIAIMHSFGGVGSGIGVFVIVFLLASSSLVDGRKALALAAGSSLILLFEHAGRYLTEEGDFTDFARAGVFGITYFVAAILSSWLATRAHQIESLAEERRIDLKNMAELNEYIIQRMGSGVLVVDEKGHISLTNDSTWFLLGYTFKAAVTDLRNLSPAIYEQMMLWRADKFQEGRTIGITGSSDIVPRFIALGEDKQHGCLIILEDSSLLNQQAQHLKLTALGRLTASIAHEIRNPLGAISHAAQLLDESNELQSADRRLVDIIKQNSVRTNTVIENVMQLTRKEQAKPEKIALKLWLHEFADEFANSIQLGDGQIETYVEPDDLQIEFDQSHLHQIMTNLCQNALRHGLEQAHRKVIELKAARAQDSRGVVLDVIDYGPGIAPELVHQIFEPFYTSASKGTGLGLYIAKELASVNQAKLDYVPLPVGGSCFRITLKGEN